MSDFFSALLDRAMDRPMPIRPRRLARFEADPNAAAPNELLQFEEETPAPTPTRMLQPTSPIDRATTPATASVETALLAPRPAIAHLAHEPLPGPSVSRTPVPTELPPTREPLAAAPEPVAPAVRIIERRIFESPEAPRRFPAPAARETPLPPPAAAKPGAPERMPKPVPSIRRPAPSPAVLRPTIQPPREAARPPAARSAQPPTIHVSIGRIEVRVQQNTTPPARSSKPAGPKLSLEQYLTGRHGNRS